MRYAAHYFEDFEPGLAFDAGPRTITREDIELFTRVSGDCTALHSDDEYAASTPFGRVVAHGALNLAAATGLAYETGVFEGTVLAVRSMETRYDRPVFPGDSVSLRLEVGSRDEHPRADRGQVRFDMALLDQHGRTVLTGTWTVVVRRRVAPDASV